MALDGERVGALILAAGRSSRLGADKAFLPLGGRPALAYSLDAFEGCAAVDDVVVVLSQANWAQGEALLRQEPWTKVRALCLGGPRRQDSVAAGLSQLPPGEWVVVHDAARPLVTPQLIDEGLRLAREHGAAVAAVPLKDTIKIVGADGKIRATPDRSSLWAAQTPQIFQRDWLTQAHREAQGDATDDAALLEERGHAVVVYPGDPANIKLTTPEDRALAEVLLRRRQGRWASGPSFRIGTGYDVHRLAEGRRLVLGGVEIPHPLGLAGHSDADVLLHALMDALLGAAGLGDIGQHFPPSDQRYTDASSLRLLSQVGEMLAAQGWWVVNVDATVVAEAPRLGPFIGEMRRRIAQTLGIEPEAVSLKATTAEGLGPIGRSEGLEAHAVALLDRANI